jgi:hypothetical protein
LSKCAGILPGKSYLKAISSVPAVFKDSTPDTFADVVITGADRLLKYVLEGKTN